MTVDITVPALGINNLDPLNKHPHRKPLNKLSSHTQISKDFDQLKFHTAASLQIPWPEQTLPTSTYNDTRLISSPYNSEPHLLDLQTLDTQSRLVSLALDPSSPSATTTPQPSTWMRLTGKKCLISSRLSPKPRGINGRGSLFTWLSSGQSFSLGWIRSISTRWMRIRIRRLLLVGAC